MRIKLFSRKPLVGRPKWYFHVIANNGEIIAQSEGYSRRLDAKSTAELLKRDLGTAVIHDV